MTAVQTTTVFGWVLPNATFEARENILWLSLKAFYKGLQRLVISLVSLIF
jgi:hypothetical protein